MAVRMNDVAMAAAEPRAAAAAPAEEEMMPDKVGLAAEIRAMLQDPNVSDEEFADRLEAFVYACSDAGMEE